MDDMYVSSIQQEPAFSFDSMDCMTKGLLSLFFLILFYGVSFARVNQADILWKSEGVDATIKCNQTHGASYYQMYWYRQRPGENMRQIVFTMPSSKPDFEADFKNERFQATKPDAESGTLTVGKLEPGDSGVYFCAVREEGTGTYEAFFGGGTKLTVLGTGLIPTKPTVKIYPPSKRERPRNKHDHKFKTLVCVASDFYPDHVKVSWEVNGEPCNERVSTDLIAQKVGETYTISSRLVVDEDKWTNSENYFNCVVNFYDGNAYTDYTATVWGIDGDKVKEEGGMSRGTYMKITQHAKLSYVVFIVKGVVYGLFVAFLLWKIQRTNGKQT